MIRRERKSKREKKPLHPEREGLCVAEEKSYARERDLRELFSIMMVDMHRGN